jgi:methyl-accepting chemotaxis protein
MVSRGYGGGEVGAISLPGGGGVALEPTVRMPRLTLVAHLPVAAKAIAVTAVGLVVLTLVLAWTVVSTVERDAQRVAANRIETAMLLAWELVLNEGAEFSVDGTTMKADKAVLNDRPQIFDKLRGVGDAVASIYADDVAIVTTVTDDTGRPVAGARLDRAAYDALLSGAKYRGEIMVLGEPYLTAYDPIKDADGKVIGALSVGLSKKSLLEGADTVRREIMLYGGIIAATVLLLLFVTLRRLLGPIELLTTVTRRIVAGEAIAAVPGVARQDDVGQLARGIQSLAQDVARKRELEAGEETRRLALEAEKQRAHSQMVDAIEAEIDRELPKITALAGRMAGAAERMVEASHRASQQCATVRDTAALAAQNANQVASAADQLSLSIGEIAARVGDATQATASAVEAAETIAARGRQLAERVGEIGRFSDLITSIANQTNLLALNATIEAARAGIAGKGFAVVATEVKGLASQTANATDEIRRQIASIQEVTDAVLGGMAEIRGMITRLDQTSTAVAAAVEQQRAATGDIARSVGESTSGISMVSDGITSVSSLASAVLEQAEGVASVSQSISTEAGALSDNTKAILRAA